MIIARYLEQYPEISVYDTYIDNGATGTNFHRPGFQQMLSDIEAGHVNCVIVKDLSRLGRNTIDTGYYIEQYFRIESCLFSKSDDVQWMAVDGFASYNLHLLQSDPDRRPRNPNPLSHLQNFFIVRVRH